MTLGKIMFTGGIVGMVICVIILCIAPAVFKKQKKKLLEEIEKDYLY